MEEARFPDGFGWGAGSAAYGGEGGWRAGGRADSIWDRFASGAARSASSESGGAADDGPRRLSEDLQSMRELHLGSYRFSVSWPRVQPGGTGAPNVAGLDHYDRLTDALLEAEIRPFPTLYHWELPQALEDRGGWPNRDTAFRFAEYAGLVAERLGDRVERWLLLDQPNVFVTLGYLVGTHAPGRRDFDAYLRAAHTANLAQGEACRVLKDVRPRAQVGSAFGVTPCEPLTDRQEDADAAERAHAVWNAWFMDPPLRGSYPEVYADGVPLARMGAEPGDLERVRAAYDFIGISCFTRFLVSASPRNDLLAWFPPGCGVAGFRQGGAGGAATDQGLEIWPSALHDAVMRIHRDYGAPAIEITANGGAFNDGPDAHGEVRDGRRIRFHQAHLAELARSITEGATVRGYHAWSLLDAWEWDQGFGARWGLIHLDFSTGERTVKASGRWYAGVAESGVVPEG